MVSGGLLLLLLLHLRPRPVITKSLEEYFVLEVNLRVLRRVVGSMVGDKRGCRSSLLLVDPRLAAAEETIGGGNIEDTNDSII